MSKPTTPIASRGWGAGGATGADAARRRRYPTLGYLEARARRRIPGFAWDFLDGGTGDHKGVGRNRAALDAIEIVPRFGAPGPVSTEVTLFGDRYDSPVGIAPVGVDGLVWPDATRPLADAAHAFRLPYIVGTLASMSIEETAARCPDTLWFQLYGMPADDHAVTFDLMRRADAAGAKALVATLDAPVRAKRPKDMRNGLVVPFRPSAKAVAQVALSWPWAWEYLRTGMPTFGSITPYAGIKPDQGEVAAFVQSHVRGTFSWDEIRRLRAAWPRALVLKGVLHPDDARKATEMGVDGILVSNHGGRQSDGSPPAIDLLPAVAEAVAGRATVLFDSGIRSGLDAVRALALGADAVFCGRAFLVGLAAMGRPGAAHVAEMLTEETRGAMAQAGVADILSLRRVDLRHPGRWHFPDRRAEGGLP